MTIILVLILWVAFVLWVCKLLKDHGERKPE